MNYLKRSISLNHNGQTEMQAGNIGLAIWRVSYFYETFVQGSTVVILFNFCAKNPPHRQAEKSWQHTSERKGFFIGF
ncbi:hypothetical protein [Chryseobacterium sp. SC28]|uniref:hypothetical protein n=1 Tax=Chryseobacterium sp. SC28 TaxID=2268028 RepID=UPI000F651666|nr:hypothetical protein [Chryseobacterium sp. SC28]